jgi:hypothetical protein
MALMFRDGTLRSVSGEQREIWTFDDLIYDQQKRGRAKKTRTGH